MRNFVQDHQSQPILVYKPGITEVDCSTREVVNAVALGFVRENKGFHALEAIFRRTTEIRKRLGRVESVLHLEDLALDFQPPFFLALEWTEPKSEIEVNTVNFSNFWPAVVVNRESFFKVKNPLLNLDNVSLAAIVVGELFGTSNFKTFFG